MTTTYGTRSARRRSLHQATPRLDHLGALALSLGVLCEVYAKCPGCNARSRLFTVKPDVVLALPRLTEKAGHRPCEKTLRYSKFVMPGYWIPPALTACQPSAADVAETDSATIKACDCPRRR